MFEAQVFVAHQTLAHSRTVDMNWVFTFMEKLIVRYRVVFCKAWFRYLVYEQEDSWHVQSIIIWIRGL